MLRGQNRVDCEEFGRLEVESGYASCLAWSPVSNATLPAGSASGCDGRGYLAAATSNGHTLNVPFCLSTPGQQARLGGGGLPGAALTGARSY